jgi:hypothetical protein
MSVSVSPFNLLFYVYMSVSVSPFSLLFYVYVSVSVKSGQGGAPQGHGRDRPQAAQQGTSKHHTS